MPRIHKKTGSCLDCGIPIHKRSLRCNSCSIKYKWKEGLFKDNKPSFRGGKLKRKCYQCSKEIEIWPYRKNNPRHFCSKECSNKYKTTLTKEKSGNWNGGDKKVRCIMCDAEKEISNSTFKRYKHFYCSNHCKAIWTKENRSGAKNYHWKGGYGTLAHRIRQLQESRDLRINCFIKNSHTCQECFQKGGKIEAHHIKAFSIIFREFLKQYSQFSPIEDKETLLRLAVSYEPFWNINNVKTLCKSCHEKTENYRGKSK